MRLDASFLRPSHSTGALAATPRLAINDKEMMAMARRLPSFTDDSLYFATVDRRRACSSIGGNPEAATWLRDSLARKSVGARIVRIAALGHAATVLCEKRYDPQQVCR